MKVQGFERGRDLVPNRKRKDFIASVMWELNAESSSSFYFEMHGGQKDAEGKLIRERVLNDAESDKIEAMFRSSYSRCCCLSVPVEPAIHA